MSISLIVFNFLLCRFETMPDGSTFMHNSTAENLRGWRFGALV